MTKEIPLTQGKVAIVDDEDYDGLIKFKWYAHWRGKNWYAERGADGKIVHMHRIILGAPNGLEVDHCNGDGLDNRSMNIRLATKFENQHNRGKQADNASGFKGVCWHKQREKWRAYIKLKGHQIHIGLYDSPEEAARAYDKRARELHGEFARTNFPPLDKLSK